ncbi:ketopantoate reductase C-terminal domain-containing protein [Anabaena sp. CCY 0017]|uniref:ketopantoate reductase C-terminal domain-containing protein n=1 Tax=Anabaena sp. CCY 0017 TaxID=3103866 RepID=UPI0039C5F83B
MCDSFGLLRDRKYAILGTGALGGFYGAKLQQSGLNVHFLPKSEVVAGAKSSGRIIPDKFIQTMLNYTLKMKPYRTSMKIDYDEHRPLEVEAIFGNPLKKAQVAGVNLPLISCLYHQLKFLNKRNNLA